MVRPTFLHRAASYFGEAYVRLTGWTSFDVFDDDPAAAEIQRDVKKAIYGFWHNRQIYMAWMHRGRPVYVLVSQSRDGEYVAQMMKRLGIPSVRGSSSRGGAQALNEMINLLKEGKQVAFSPDGPRGPAGSVQPGIVAAAQKSGAPVVFTSSASRRKWVFKSWDRFQLPLPFGVNVLRHARPAVFQVEEPADEVALRIRDGLNACSDAAAQTLQESPSWPFLALGGMGAVCYNLVFTILGPAVLPCLALFYGFKRSLRDWKDRAGMRPVPRPVDRRLWMHAASIGEWKALKPFLAEFREAEMCEMFLTTGTPEAKRLIQREEPSLPVFLLPLDFPFLMRRFVRRVRPFAVVVVETELWPNFLSSLFRSAVPVFLINGRLSEKSVRRWRAFKPMFYRLGRAFSFVYARGEDDRRRFVSLGLRPSRIQAAGNLKYDNLRMRVAGERDELRARYFGFKDGFVFAAGSTWPDEEALLLDAWEAVRRSGDRLIVAPRRIQRCRQVESLLERTGRPWTRWSRAKKAGGWDTDLLLADTLGDLELLYRTADAAFVGGSLSPHGGQNPLEPAACGIPVLFGPSMENFSAERDSLISSGAAAAVSGKDDLITEIRLIKEDASLRGRRGEAAVRTVRTHQGTASRIARDIKEKLNL